MFTCQAWQSSSGHGRGRHCALPPAAHHEGAACTLRVERSRYRVSALSSGAWEPSVSEPQFPSVNDNLQGTFQLACPTSLLQGGLPLGLRRHSGKQGSIRQDWDGFTPQPPGRLVLTAGPEVCTPSTRRELVPFGFWDPWAEELGQGLSFSVSPAHPVPIPVTQGTVLPHSWTRSSVRAVCKYSGSPCSRCVGAVAGSALPTP